MKRLAELVKLPKSRNALSIAVAVVAGLTAGLVLLPRAPGPGESDEPLPELAFLGQKLNTDDTAGKQALERARRYVSGKLTLELPDGSKREVYLGEIGAEIDKVRLANLVRQAKDRTSMLVRGFRAANQEGPLTLPVPVALNGPRAVAALGRLKDETDRLPADARMDLDARKLVPEVMGRLLDVDGSMLAIETALARGERSAKLAYLERRPRRIAAELGKVELDAVLGFFETSYDRSERMQARTYNLRLAASKLDGTVLLPGEEFDFNDVVGPRDEANGYKVATVIAEGELVDGIGGGTCQISGTLHGAAFFGGLSIVERYPHTRPSSYIKMGLDATVVYPTINFRIKNPFPFPVVLHQTVKNGVVRAEILGPKRTRTVTLIRRIDSAIPYDEVERPDKALPSGVRRLGQRGVAGFKLRRYRIVRDGAHAVRERWDDTYPPTSQIVRVGTGEMPKDSVKAEDDKHPEYVADELLVVTQGESDSDEPGAERSVVMRESREAGRFGDKGWTESAGMPFWESRPKAEESSDAAGPGAAEAAKTKKKKAKG
ncbi:MAG: putative secreted protein [Polyangiaceae bacterium]|nr:putative secreted protein [Polyangiaceae bacterium]